jgi:hypothetical protein
MDALKKICTLIGCSIIGAMLVIFCINIGLLPNYPKPPMFNHFQLTVTKIEMDKEDRFCIYDLSQKNEKNKSITKLRLTTVCGLYNVTDCLILNKSINVVGKVGNKKKGQ